MSTEAIIISEGTLRLEDLIPAFVAALSWRKEAISRTAAAEEDPEVSRLVEEIEELIRDVEWRLNIPEYLGGEQVTANLDAEELFHYLEQAAPEGMYFGTSEVDGACFGFWPIEPEPYA